MLSVDHSNTDGPPLAVKCVRKFWYALGGDVTLCMCARTRTCSSSTEAVYSAFLGIIKITMIWSLAKYTFGLAYMSFV